MSKQTAIFTLGILAVIVVGVGIGAGAVYLTEGDDRAESSKLRASASMAAESAAQDAADMDEYLAAEQRATELCKEHEIESYKDPESARFRNVLATNEGPGRWTVTGEVNAKNSYGAYVGYEFFRCTVKPDGNGRLVAVEGYDAPAATTTPGVADAPAVETPAASIPTVMGSCFDYEVGLQIDGLKCVPADSYGGTRWAPIP